MQNSTTKSDTAPSADPLTRFKEAQREGWAHFAPLEALTTPPESLDSAEAQPVSAGESG